MVDVEQTVREYIDKSLHMSMATVSGNKPWVCEVHFVYDSDLNLYWRSKATKRHSQEITANPNVAGNIVATYGLQDGPVVGIYFEGSAEQLDDVTAQRAVLPLFMQRVGATETAVDEAAAPDGHKFYKITVENWYAFGKFDEAKAEKYKLVWNGGAKSSKTPEA